MQGRFDQCCETCLHGICIGARIGGEIFPTGNAQSVAPGGLEIGLRSMQPRQSFARLRAVHDVRFSQRHAVEEGQQGCRPAVQDDRILSGAVADRLRTVDAARGQMFHEPEKEGQVVGADALFIKREDVAAALRLQVEIGILHAFGNTLETARASDVVFGQKLFQVFEGNVGVDSHAPLTLTRAAR